MRGYSKDSPWKMSQKCVLPLKVEIRLEVEENEWDFESNGVP